MLRIFWRSRGPSDFIFIRLCGYARFLGWWRTEKRIKGSDSLCHVRRERSNDLCSQLPVGMVDPYIQKEKPMQTAMTSANAFQTRTSKLLD